MENTFEVGDSVQLSDYGIRQLSKDAIRQLSEDAIHQLESGEYVSDEVKDAIRQVQRGEYVSDKVTQYVSDEVTAHLIAIRDNPKIDLTVSKLDSNFITVKSSQKVLIASRVDDRPQPPKERVVNVTAHISFFKKKMSGGSRKKRKSSKQRKSKKHKKRKSRKHKSRRRHR